MQLTRGPTVSDFDFTGSEKGHFDDLLSRAAEDMGQSKDADVSYESPKAKGARASPSSGSGEPGLPMPPSVVKQAAPSSGACLVCAEPKHGKQAYCRLHKRAAQNIDTAGQTLLRTRGPLLVLSAGISACAKALFSGFLNLSLLT